MILIDTVPTEDSYAYLCIRALRCDRRDDTHDRACHAVNDEERRHFYAGMVDELLRANA